ncbi:MAG TPA: winged helix-turn-helix domain-containing protein [Patescibacteria group bacterium]
MPVEKSIVIRYTSETETVASQIANSLKDWLLVGVRNKFSATKEFLPKNTPVTLVEDGEHSRLGSFPFIISVLIKTLAEMEYSTKDADLYVGIGEKNERSQVHRDMENDTNFLIGVPSQEFILKVIVNITSLLAEAHSEIPQVEQRVQLGNTAVYFDRKKNIEVVTINGQEVELAPNRAILLKTLLRTPTSYVSYRGLAVEIYGYPADRRPAIKALVNFLRITLNEYGSDCEIEVGRGVGYRIKLKS